MKGILIIVSALAIVGLLVWCRIRYIVIPPNARLLFDLWASLEKDVGSGSQVQKLSTKHSMKREGQSAR